MIRELVRELGLIAFSLLVILSFALSTYPKTAEGVHCPAAVVQRIEKQGTLVSPEIGDAAFEQCRCAEAQSADQGASSEKLTVYVLSVPALDLPLASGSFLIPLLPSGSAQVARRIGTLLPESKDITTPPPQLA
ncbi:MAG: hypothetical protein LCH41_05440 [Armatimonadetes bacterium]|nr:hypothetical protein [Armatimonadota bacterium]